MPYIEVLDSKYFNRYIFKFDKYNYLKDYLVSKFNLNDYDFEFHFNWGMYKNNVYLLDYGHNYLSEFLDLK